MAPATESTVTVEIALGGTAALDETALRIDDARLVGDTLELTAAVGDATTDASETDRDAETEPTESVTAGRPTDDNADASDDPAPSRDSTDAPSPDHAAAVDTPATETDGAGAQASDRATAEDAPSPSGSGPDTAPPASGEAERGTETASGAPNEPTPGETADSVGEATGTDATAVSDGGDAEVTADGPVHRDPDQLAAVYDPDATFTEMTEALGADVTPQTVRNYMIEYGLHEPSPRGIADSTHDDGDDTAASGIATAARARDADTESDPESEAAGASTADSADTPAGAASAATATEDASPDEQEGTATEATAANSSAADASPDHSRAEPAASVGNESAEPLTVAAVRDRTGPLNLPADVEPDQLVAAVAGSRTVYEVRKHLGLDDRETRTLLKRCGLIDLVTGRITGGSTAPDEQDVIRRLIDASDGTDSAEPSTTTS
ncbi:hypothetical protein DM2_672 [Halorubrum sp. DM2]|nr:hypothetical protein DM2_672 [Halorubrum sp. DM2]